MHNNRFWVILWRFRKIDFFHILGQGSTLGNRSPRGHPPYKKPKGQILDLLFWLTKFFRQLLKKFLQKTKIGRNSLSWVEFQAMRTHFSGVRTLWAMARARARQFGDVQISIPKSHFFHMGLQFCSNLSSNHLTASKSTTPDSISASKITFEHV